MSQKREIEVTFRGQRYRISPKHAAELNRRGFLQRSYSGAPIRVPDDPFINVRGEPISA